MSAYDTPDALFACLPLGRGVRVLAVSPQGLVALEKPADIKTHPNASGADPESLLVAPYDADKECYRWQTLPDVAADAPRALWLLNRLDAPTSGIVMAALTEKAALAGRDCFAGEGAEKIYYAIVRKNIVPAQGVWRDRLARHRLPGKGVRVSGGEGAEAVTAYECREPSLHFRDAHLVRLRPHTGRTHQLRVQCALHNHPIAGDRTYGDFDWNKALAKRSGLKRLFLHCAATRLTLSSHGLSGVFTVQCPPPAAFEAMMGTPLSLGKR